jgi:hypothetical protein
VEDAWIKDPVDWQSFADIRVHTIDLRDLKARVRDDDEGDDLNQPIPPRVLEDVANTLYAGMVQVLRDIKPVIDGQDIDRQTKSMIMDIKLAALIETADSGLLQNWLEKKITGGASHSVDLAFSCQIKSSQADEILLTFESEHNIILQDLSRPFSEPQDLEELNFVAQEWARQIKSMLENE